MTGDDWARAWVPDVLVRESPGSPVLASSEADRLQTQTEPLILRRTPSDDAIQGFIEIVEDGSGHVVTVIEVLSPSNKLPGPGRDLYLRKQAECLETGVNLVEIDLVRQGVPTTLARQSREPARRGHPNHVTVVRAQRPLDVEYYPIPLRQPLPTIKVPLRPLDADVRLALEPLLDRAYERGRHDDLDYRQTLQPPLAADDIAWLNELLRSRTTIP